jgi:hypothetical protein
MRQTTQVPKPRLLVPLYAEPRRLLRLFLIDRLGLLRPAQQRLLRPAQQRLLRPAQQRLAWLAQQRLQQVPLYGALGVQQQLQVRRAIGPSRRLQPLRTAIVELFARSKQRALFRACCTLTAQEATSSASSRILR